MDPAVRNGGVHGNDRGGRGQAAELVLLLDVLDAAGFASEDAPFDEDEDDVDEADVEDDAGELLDDAPRLSLR